MATSIPDRVRAAAALLLLVALAPCGVDAARDSDLPINLEAASSDFDYKNNALLFRRVKITQGTTQVEAEEARANGLNFENSEWRFKGAVRIVLREGRLNSDEARVIFRDNEISRAVIEGRQASFEQRLEKEQQLARGRADRIEYNVQERTVRLSGDAWLTDGRNSVSAPTLVYDIDGERVVGNPTGKDTGPVHFVILPPADDKPAGPPKDPAQ